MDDLKSKGSYAIGDELKSKINRLKLENTSLVERNLNLLCIVSDLNTKIKDLEYDKMSLITAIQLLQVDLNVLNVQEETTGSWTEIRSKKVESKHSTQSSNASRSSVITDDNSFDDKFKGPSVRVNANSFSLLSVEGTDTSANEERNANVIAPNTSDDRPRKNDQRQKSRGDGFQGNTSVERSRKNDQRQMSRGHGFQENTSDDRPRKNEQRQKDRKTVIIAGDSMIQHVHGWKMSNTEVSVAVKTFSNFNIESGFMLV